LGNAWSEWYLVFVLGFYEGHVVGFDHFVRCPVIAAVRLRVLSVADQNVLLRALVYLRIVFVQDEDESAASYLTQVGDVRFAATVSLEGGDIFE